MKSADCDRGEPQGHRDEEEERSDVVPAAEDDRHAADVLRALNERQQGSGPRVALVTNGVDAIRLTEANSFAIR